MIGSKRNRRKEKSDCMIWQYHIPTNRSVEFAGLKNPSSNIPPEETRVSPSRRNWPCDNVSCPLQVKNRDRDKNRRKKKRWKLDGLFGEEEKQSIARPPLPTGGGIRGGQWEGKEDQRARAE